MNRRSGRTAGSVLFKAKKNTIRMMKDRGYYIDDEDEAILNMNLNEFLINFNLNNSDVSVEVLNKEYNSDNDITYIFFTDFIYDDEVIGGGSFKKIDNERLQSVIGNALGGDSADINKIVIGNKDPTKEVSDSFVIENIEYLRYDNLLIRPEDHVFSWKHELIDREQVAKDFNDTGRSISQLIEISVNDPVSIWYNIDPGDIFRINRGNFGINTIADRSVEYRRVTRIPLMKASAEKSVKDAKNKSR